jgi:group I intron endonuclease
MNDNRKYQKQQYKQTHTEMGVYQIKNQLNGKIFVGSSMDLTGIWNRHRFELKVKSHKNKDLQNDWNIHGEGNFLFDVLENIKPEEETVTDLSDLKKYQKKLKVLEEKWFESLQPYQERGYHQ